MKRTITLMLLLLCSIADLCAQNGFVVSGRVTDHEQHAIAGAQLYFYQGEDMVAMIKSDKDGYYESKPLPAGQKYAVEASCLGYQSKTDSLIVRYNTIHNFVLEEVVQTLDSVTVYAQRGQQTTNGFVFHLSEKARKCGNPFVAMKEIPMLVTDPVMETVQLTSGEKMLILVDGMMANSGVSPIDPSRIKSIEINDVVSAKYQALGYQKVMDIKLKETDYYLYHQTAERIDLPDRYAFLYDVIEVGNQDVSVYASIFPTYTTSDCQSDYSMTSPWMSRSMTSESQGEDYSLEHEFMVKWRMTRNDHLTFSVQGRNTKSLNSTNSDGLYDGLPMAQYQHTKYHSHVNTLQAYYRHKFDKGGTLEATASYNDNRSDNDSRMNETIGSETGMNRVFYHALVRNSWLTVDYNHDLGNGTSLNAGSMTRYITDRTDNTTLGETLSFKHWSFDQRLYAGLQGMLGKKLVYYLSGGVVWNDMHYATYVKTYVNPYADMRLTWMVNDRWRLSLYYNYEIYSPNISILNPYNVSADTLVQTHGNPDIRQQKSHSVRFNANYYKGQLNFGFNGGAMFNHDAITPIYSLTDYGALLTSYGNRDGYWSCNIGGFLGYSGNNVRLSANASAFMEHYQTVGNKGGCSMGGQVQWWPANKVMLHAKMSYAGVTFGEYSKHVQYVPFLEWSVTYSFTNNMYLRFMLQNSFGNARDKDVIALDGYRSVNHQKVKNLSPMILFRWTIRKNENKKMRLDNNMLKTVESGVKL